MSDGPAEGGGLGAFGIDVDELLVLGQGGEGVDAGLIQGEPAADADLLADQGWKFAGLGHDALLFSPALRGGDDDEDFG
ncbi:hypothetical protein D3C80_1341340 [compost metagenome]